MSTRPLRALLGVAAAVVLGGCSGLPDPPDKADLDPAKAGRLAIEEFDANKDGKIDSDEIKKSPGLMESLETMDDDGDGSLTAGEISQRVREWLDGGTNVFTESSTVYLDGEPLEGATITYDPEDFLEPGLQPTSGVTDATGSAFPQGQDAKYPGLYPGVYSVRISKVVDGRETIPARYNTETILGKEIGFDAPSTHRLLKFELTSN